MGTAASRGGAFRAPTMHPVTGVREDGMRWVRSFKIEHLAGRGQRVYLVPVPRFATKQYYNDWVYQPYIKDNMLCISTDIEGPPFYQNFAYRLYFKSRKETELKDYDIYYSPNMPDSVDPAVNITRHEMFQKEYLIRTPIWRMLLTTTQFRDRFFHYAYVRRGLLKTLGSAENRYHPGIESGESFVIFMPVPQMNTAINVMEELGFTVTEAIEHEIGEEEKLAKLHAVGSWGHRMLVLYTWFLVWAVLNKYVEYVMGNAEKHKDEYLELRARMLKEGGH